jgi:uncharacterized damage-inducible protein DinB
MAKIIIIFEKRQMWETVYKHLPAVCLNKAVNIANARGIHLICVMIQAPEKNEYSAYFQRYIDLVPAGDYWSLLDKNTEILNGIFGAIPEARHDFHYAEGKWSVKEMLMHIIDTERVFSYRMLVGGRGDEKTVLYPMDPDGYAATADVSSRSVADLLEEFKTVRASTRFLLKGLDQAQLAFLANGVTHPVSARALAYITIGHAMHHIGILEERYLDAGNG